MKEILGHRSWNRREVLAFLRKSGTFTMCSLPHYRFWRVREICHRLHKKGWIEKSGETDTSVNWRVTEKWRAYHNGSDLV